ncbi:zinc-binding alcohol dehydrogenase [Nocardia panacis]|uniref:Zinc-binding alcohol dehydrogenase n=1 Tax=Nocardia panacis TaxID=2340916 RepID=A0A3A4KJ61_9NOCA|nr:alcohol dehydrogenase catalytic domain-containing protein [Nocardia panacis]RJO73733.1 zinc-binding alcohol dehydrogenase [Nocardia panacis]
MKALVYEGPTRLALRDTETPAPGPGAVAVRPIAVGICGSDVHGYTGSTGRRRAGQVMGHEIVGTVTEVGAGVDLSVGDAVVVNPVLGCGRCAVCADRRSDLCEEVKVMGVDTALPGGFAECLIVPARNAIRVRQAHPACALTEPLAVGLHAARRAGVGPGARVAVIGSGMVGVATAWGALHEGAACVHVVDIDQEKLEGANRIGATGLRTAPGRPLIDVLIEAGVAKVDIVLDAVGSDDTVRSALGATRRGGVVGLVGMATPSLRLPDFTLITNQQQLVGTWCYAEQDFATAAHAVAADPDRFSWLIDRRVELAGAPRAFEELSSGYSPKFKVLVTP